MARTPRRTALDDAIEKHQYQRADLKAQLAAVERVIDALEATKAAMKRTRTPKTPKASGEPK